MADQKHLKLLLASVHGWNEARVKRPFKVDLRGADLQGADLQGADLRRADLLGADLQGADLRRADLQGADLQGANLRKAAMYSTLLPETSNRVEYIDLRFTKGLVQEQVHMMLGDTGVMLPEELTHPSHWPDWRERLGVEVDAEGNEAQAEPAEVPTPRVVKFTSPAEFDLIKAKLDILLDPVNATSRTPSRAPVSPETRDNLVRAIEAMAEQLVESLSAYQSEDTNRVHAAEQLARAAKRLQGTAAAGGPRLLIPLFYGLVEAIDRAHLEDATALEAMDREMFVGLIDMSRSVYAFYPELAEGLDPLNANAVPDNPGVTSDELIIQLRGLFEGEVTRGAFTDKTRDFFEAEVNATTPEGVDPEKFKIARLGAIAGEVVRRVRAHEAVPTAEQSAQWTQVSMTAAAIWQLVAPFLGM